MQFTAIKLISAIYHLHHYIREARVRKLHQIYIYKAVATAEHSRWCAMHH